MSDDSFEINLIDWEKFGKAKPLSLEELAIYKAAELEPFTAHLAQRLCERFKISSKGVRNLTNAFAGLTHNECLQGTISIGWGDWHVVTTILKSDEGFLMVSILGALCEYFHEDTVVQFLELLAHQSKTPPQFVPTRRQWRQLVRACYSVLAICPLATTISGFHDHCAASPIPSKPEHLLSNLTKISDLVKGKRISHSITAGPEIAWYAAISQWLFDVQFSIEDQDGKELYVSPGGTTKTVPLVMKVGNAPPVAPIKYSLGDIPTEAPTILTKPNIILGGRVAWENLFRDTFGKAYTSLEPDCVAGIICCSSAMTHQALRKNNIDEQTIFLNQACDVPGLAGHGLNETILAWFPELRRLSPRIEKWHKKMTKFEDNKTIFDEQIHSAEAKCKCVSCGNEPDPSSCSDICQVSLLQVIVSLGLLIARMIPAAGIFPKRNGILQFYRSHHQDRISRLLKGSDASATDPSKTAPSILSTAADVITNNLANVTARFNLGSQRPAEDFNSNLIASLPTPVEMLTTTSLIFSGYYPDPPLPERSLALTHAGMVISLNFIKGMPSDNLPLKHVPSSASVVIHTGGSFFHYRLFNHTIWHEGLGYMTFAEQFDALKNNIEDLKQICRMCGPDRELSIVQIGKNGEGSDKLVEAREKGWFVL